MATLKLTTTNPLNNILIGTGHPDLIRFNSNDFKGLMVRFLPNSWLLPSFELLNKAQIWIAHPDLFLSKYCWLQRTDSPRLATYKQLAEQWHGLDSPG